MERYRLATGEELAHPPAVCLECEGLVPDTEEGRARHDLFHERTRPQPVPLNRVDSGPR